MVIDKKKLSHYAVLLEVEIGKLKGKDEDVHELASFDWLQNYITDAKAGKVSEPCETYGLIRWVLE